MDKIFEFAQQNFPNLVGVGIFIICVWFVISQYHQIQASIEKKVNDTVSAKLGEIIGSLQTALIRAEEFAKLQEEKVSSLNEKHDKISLEIDEKNSQIISQFNQIESRFSLINSALPDIENYSAEDLLNLARRSDGTKAAQFCALILHHKDASSRILELAGDLMRDSKRFSLAKELYQRSYGNDDERLGAFIEFITLKAEIDPIDRDKNLDDAISRVVANPEFNQFIRVANALISLERFSKLRDFCEAVYEKIKGIDRELESASLRNMGTANKKLNLIKESLENYSEAFQLTPNDQNAVRMYADSLEDAGQYEDFIALRKKLLLMDPTDLNYYFALVGALIKYGSLEEAKEWLVLASTISDDEGAAYTLRQFALRIEAKSAVAGLMDR